MNILVTGCNGFIGQSICETLKYKGYTVIGLGVEDHPLTNIDKYIACDISDAASVEQILPYLSVGDSIVHTAALLNKGDFDSKLINVNCIGALNILELAVKAKCRKIINISSAPIIGIPYIHPIDENHPIQPRSLYHVTKVMQEHIFELAEKYDITSINIRIPSPIGIRMNPSTILAVFIKRCINNEPIEILGKGSRRQNYIDVRDIANFVEKCQFSDTIKGTYIIGSNDTISNLELAKKCVSISEASSEIIFSQYADSQEGIIWDYSCDCAKEIGFICKYSIDDSIRDIISAWRKRD